MSDVKAPRMTQGASFNNGVFISTIVMALVSKKVSPALL